MADLPRLSRAVAPCDARLLELPEKVLQFGTGGFLRGFIEYFIDEANRAGTFDGRIVAVGSTGSGRDRTLTDQDGLFTLAIRGIVNGRPESSYQLISSLSRAISAADHWDDVLAIARTPELEFIFSNTTEAGIRSDAADARGPSVPRSFPAKLTSVLYERARAFDFDAARGVVVLPCELIEDNGDRLKEIVLELAARWQLDPQFAVWLEDAVPFCNTLVDRIVPGEPVADEKLRMWQELGYRDELLTTCEFYRLFAIEADDVTATQLRFASADPGIIIAHDISPYRERKVRLLNGTHTIMVPAAILAGCQTVGEAVQDDVMGAFVRRVLFSELAASTSVAGAQQFAEAVLDRFANPYIKHALLDITLQQTAKLRVRMVPALLDYARRFNAAPAAMAAGFAAYLLFMREVRTDQRPDDGAERVRAHLAAGSIDMVVRAVCADETLWGTDLTQVNDFAEQVTELVGIMESYGVRAALMQLQSAEELA